MLDNVANFVQVQTSTGYAAGATSIILSSGQGSLLPAAPFNLIWWNVTDYPNPTNDPNREIVRITGISGDTLTITRAQEGTSATAKNSSGKIYNLVLGITAKMITDIAAQTANGIPVYNEIVSGSGTTFTLAHTPVAGTVRLYAGGNSEPQTGRLLPGAGNDFTISGAVITMLNGSFDAGTILADYNY
jgi:hypothetical protein